jgi:endonuclease-8
MPEGPEIKRAADRIAEVLERRTAARVEFGLPKLRRLGPRLSGRRIDQVEARGKALLIHFEGDDSLYTHNQLYGRWEITAANARPPSTRSLRLAIDTRSASALLYSASDLSLWKRAELSAHPYLARLGVELIGTATDTAAVRRQLDDSRFQNRTLAALLLDQGFLAGVGNYLRSEILFAARLRPEARLRELDVAARLRLASAALELTRQSYRTGGITNDLTRAASLKKRGVTFGRFRHHVFDREGEPCWTCRTTVRRHVLAGRNVFICPTCQR